MKSISSVEDLREVAWAFRASRVLMLAHKLGLFTLLSKGPLSAKEISSAQESDPDMTERLLIACTALGLLKKKGSIYENSAVASRYLVEGTPSYQGSWIDHAADDLWGYWGDELDKELGGKRPDDPGWTTRFVMAMHSIAVGGEAEELAHTIDLRGRKMLLDIGGGPGTYSIYLCKTNPKLKAVVFDQPEAVEIAKGIIESYGMADRISTKAGSWDSDNFGEDADVVLLSNVLHGPGSKAEMKLKKSFNSLVSGGILIIRDFILNDDKSGPISPALFNIMVGAYAKKEIYILLFEAGFTNIRDVEIPHKTHSVITALKP